MGSNITTSKTDTMSAKVLNAHEIDRRSKAKEEEYNREEDSSVEDSSEEDSSEEDSREENSSEEDSRDEDSSVEGGSEQDSTIEDGSEQDSGEEYSSEKKSSEEGSSTEGETGEDDSGEEDTSEGDTSEEDTEDDVQSEGEAEVSPDPGSKAEALEIGEELLAKDERQRRQDNYGNKEGQSRNEDQERHNQEGGSKECNVLENERTEGDIQVDVGGKSWELVGKHGTKDEAISNSRGGGVLEGHGKLTEYEASFKTSISSTCIVITAKIRKHELPADDKLERVEGNNGNKGSRPSAGDFKPQARNLGKRHIVPDNVIPVLNDVIYTSSPCSTENNWATVSNREQEGVLEGRPMKPNQVPPKHDCLGNTRANLQNVAVARSDGTLNELKDQNSNRRNSLAAREESRKAREYGTMSAKTETQTRSKKSTNAEGTDGKNESKVNVLVQNSSSSVENDEGKRTAAKANSEVNKSGSTKWEKSPYKRNTRGASKERAAEKTNVEQPSTKKTTRSHPVTKDMTREERASSAVSSSSTILSTYLSAGEPSVSSASSSTFFDNNTEGGKSENEADEYETPISLQKDISKSSQDKINKQNGDAASNEPDREAVDVTVREDAQNFEKIIVLKSDWFKQNRQNLIYQEGKESDDSMKVQCGQPDIGGAYRQRLFHKSDGKARGKRTKESRNKSYAKGSSIKSQNGITSPGCEGRVPVKYESSAFFDVDRHKICIDLKGPPPSLPPIKQAAGGPSEDGNQSFTIELRVNFTQGKKKRVPIWKAPNQLPPLKRSHPMYRRHLRSTCDPDEVNQRAQYPEFKFKTRERYGAYR